MSAEQEIMQSILSEDQWRQLFVAWEQSGESQRGFCTRQGISHNSFCYQRSKLLYTKRKSTSKSFATIKCNSPKVAAELKLLLPNNIILLLPSTIDSTTLTTIFTSLALLP